MPRKKIAMSELRRLKTGSKQPISFESADDLPLNPCAWVLAAQYDQQWSERGCPYVKN